MLGLLSHTLSRVLRYSGLRRGCHAPRSQAMEQDKALEVYGDCRGAVGGSRVVPWLRGRGMTGREGPARGGGAQFVRALAGSVPPGVRGEPGLGGELCPGVSGGSRGAGCPGCGTGRMSGLCGNWSPCQVCAVTLGVLGSPGALREGEGPSPGC